MSALSLSELRGQGADERTIQVIENNRPMLQETLQEQGTSCEEVNGASRNIGQGSIQYGTIMGRQIQLGMRPTPPLGPWLQDTRQRDQNDLALAIHQHQAALQHLLTLQSQAGQQLQPQLLDGVDRMLGDSQTLQQKAPTQTQPQPTENVMKGVTNMKSDSS